MMSRDLEEKEVSVEKEEVRPDNSTLLKQQSYQNFPYFFFL